MSVCIAVMAYIQDRSDLAANVRREDASFIPIFFLSRRFNSRFGYTECSEAIGYSRIKFFEKFAFSVKNVAEIFSLKFLIQYD